MTAALLQASAPAAAAARPQQAAAQLPGPLAGMHWAERYIGLAWTPEHDCWAFVRRVWADEYGWDVPPLDLGQHVPAVYARAATELEGALQWLPVAGTDCTDGDAVVMGRAGRATHIGVCAIVDGQRWLLHCLRGAGVVCHPPDRLRQHDLRILRCWRHPSRAEG